MESWYEATARERIAGLADSGSFREILPPTTRTLSPHLQALDLPVAFDDGVVIGAATLDGRPVLVAAQEGGFMGGAVGEVQGAKLVGLLERASREQVAGVLLLLETGGVRLQEANAGLIAVSEVMRAIAATRADGIPVVAAIGGQYGCFGGMGIAAACCTAIVMSEEGRLGLSGPEVIETAHGVEEYDSRDRARVWRTTGGKHRWLTGDCQYLVDDRIADFRAALVAAIETPDHLDVDTLAAEQRLLAARIDHFGDAKDGADVWRALGLPDAERVSMQSAAALVAEATPLRARAGIGLAPAGSRIAHGGGLEATPATAAIEGANRPAGVAS